MKSGGDEGAIRIDRLLVYLRFARTRSAAANLIDTHALRRNRKHVLRGSEPVRIGDVLTLAVGWRGAGDRTPQPARPARRTCRGPFALS